MAGIERKAQIVNLWTALLQRGWAALVALGIDGKITALLLAALVAVWGAIVKVLDGLPWWALFAVALMLAILSTRLLADLRRAWAIRGMKRLNLAQIGVDCQKFRDDVFEFLVARLDNAPPQIDLRQTSTKEEGRDLMHEEWVRRTTFSRQTEARAVQKFGHRAIAICHLLREAEIQPPDLWSFSHELAGIAAHIGAIGELLERGLLKEARNFRPENIRNIHLYIG